MRSRGESGRLTVGVHASLSTGNLRAHRTPPLLSRSAHPSGRRLKQRLISNLAKTNLCQGGKRPTLRPTMRSAPAEAGGSKEIADQNNYLNALTKAPKLVKQPRRLAWSALALHPLHWFPSLSASLGAGRYSAGL